MADTEDSGSYKVAAVDDDYIEYSKDLKAEQTSIPGLLMFDLPVHGDNRGWFKENWQRDKKTRLGLPDFGPVQNNISYNLTKGTTRGIHAEPWDKFISVAKGRVFTAIVDLRAGPTFGHVETITLDPSKAIFVPRGCGNSFQTLDDDTVYTYLVNDHWYPDAEYTVLNLADPTINVKWPIPLEYAELSDKDKNHPFLEDVKPMGPKKTLVLGGAGLLGKSLRKAFPDAEFVGRDVFDITNPESYQGRNWRQYEFIINAAGYTSVDEAETPEGRKKAWLLNADAIKLLARYAQDNGVTLIHISSDYVFDGSLSPHDEDEMFSPLNVYGQSTAAGDISAGSTARHYIIRTSWMVGDGKNFVDSMRQRAERGEESEVVNDQQGRLTFADDVSAAIKHLMDSGQSYGTYNVTCDGKVASWATIAKKVYELAGADPELVHPVSSEDYQKHNDTTIAPRPKLSELRLEKIKATGFTPRDWETALAEYLQKERNES
jgi:dTDP-4-dehydrorhamnose reductase/dTDP-4-dehydrorhamnose 3,5-epimerase